MDEAPSSLAGLNPQQREAVAAVAGPVLILAGAGSGKTRVITHRIAHLVLDLGVPSRRILAVTFTNKAAAEMRSRVEALLGERPFETWVQTFHSFCVRLLRREARAAGLDPGFLIYDDDDQLAAVREAMRRLDLSEKLHPPRRFLSRISARKNAARGSADADFELDRVSEVMQGYHEVLRAANALDFDDLLLKAVAVLENEAVCAAWRERFPYLLVDEYQDTNRTQYQLVRRLAGPGGNLTVVGDEDQSIYSWRGADISNILDFERDFPGARVFRLEQNYRSSQRILDAAGALVARNERRKGKTLVAVKGAGELVRLHEAADEFEEAAWVTERTAVLRGKGRVAVLFRMNAQSRLIEEGLLRLRIPYMVVGGVGFYERREVKDVLAYLRLVLNPRDSVAFRRVVNVPARGIGQKTLEEIDAVARERSLSAWEAAAALVDEARLPARALAALRQFKETIETLRLEMEVAPGAAPRSLKGLVERVLELSGYGASLAREDSQESQDRLENLAELIGALTDYKQREPGASLSRFLDRAALLSETDRMKDDVPVLLLTLHAAKGLEFDAVFLVGLEEGLLPHSRSLTSAEGLEEERRLCYVGMTRAKGVLHLSWARSRQVFGQRRLTEKSRFIDEVPAELIARSGGLFQSPLRAERPAWARERPAPVATPSVDAGPAAAADDAAIRPGIKVRHPLFGVGTVLRREGDGADFKVTVSFPGVGAKKLVARYAGLEVV